MTSCLSRYLEHIQKSENLTFAIDSIPKQDKKKKKIIRPTYPKRKRRLLDLHIRSQT